MTPAALRRVAEQASPRHRAWRRLLGSLTVDPDALPRPVPSPGHRDFLICGSPRSGTALLGAMLFQPPSVVTVMEPWDALRLPPRELFSSIRRELDDTRRLARGRLDVPALVHDGSVTWCRDGERPVEVDLAKDYLLGVKLPAFWRYLDLLPETRFLVCLRHPAEVVASYAATGGRLREGLDYDVPFNREMNRALLEATDDPEVRRVLLWEYVHARIVPALDRPTVHAVRYERWFTEPTEQLREIGEFLGIPLDHAMARLRAPSSSRETDLRLAVLLRALAPSAATLGYRV